MNKESNVVAEYNYWINNDIVANEKISPNKRVINDDVIPLSIYLKFIKKEIVKRYYRK